MSSTTSKYTLKFHSFFNMENTSADTETKLELISSSWDDDQILRLDENNWQ